MPNPTVDNNYWIRIRVSSTVPPTVPGVFTQQLTSTGGPNATVWVAIDPNEETVFPPAEDGGVNYVHWGLESGLDDVVFDSQGTRGGIVMGSTWPVPNTRVPVLENCGHAKNVLYVMGFTNGPRGTQGADTYEYEYTVNFSCAGSTYTCDPKLGMGSPPT